VRGKTSQEELEDNAVRASLLLLTCTAGIVDATAYLRLGQVFVANMTGNTVLLALRVGGVEPSAVAGNLIALIGFCAGAGLGAVLHRESRKPATQHLVPILVVEVILMGSAALLWQFTQGLNQLMLIGIASVAMGLQAAMASRVAMRGVPTITVTNTLTRAMSELVSRIRGERTDNKWSSLPVFFLALDWFAYFVGALVAAAGLTLRLDNPFVLAVLLLTIVLLLAIRMRRLAEDGKRHNE
jgi:uncharacterized membrane protein YoaK (UPF0700 family)